jgi:hypothetical protein
MERTKKWKKASFSSILCAFAAILLCAVPNVWADVKVPPSGPNINYLVVGNLWIYGTANILPGAEIQWATYALSNSIVNITGGVFGLEIDIASGAIVTIYGTNFNLSEGTHLNYQGVVTGSYENTDAIYLNVYCQDGASITLAAPGSPPQPNQPPETDAGTDLTVFTKDIDNTIINGTATDPDEDDILQYHWLVDGAATDPDYVGAGGEAPLNLGTVDPAYLGIGTHTLTLEVTDGTDIVSDDMVLTIMIAPVTIDIKPGSYPNSINLGSNGVVPVAILSTSDFDATLISADTVFLAGSGVAVRGKGNNTLAHEEDVNADGLMDLVVQVLTENLDPGTFQDGGAYLRIHETSDQTSIVLYQGWDEITIVPL